MSCYHPDGILKHLNDLSKCYRCGKNCHLNDGYKESDLIELTGDTRFTSVYDHIDTDDDYGMYRTPWQNHHQEWTINGAKYIGVKMCREIDLSTKRVDDLSYKQHHESVYEKQWVTSETRSAGRYYSTRTQMPILVKPAHTETVNEGMTITFYTNTILYKAYKVRECFCSRCCVNSNKINLMARGDHCLYCGFCHCNKYASTNDSNYIFKYATGEYNSCNTCSCLHCIYYSMSDALTRINGVGCNLKDAITEIVSDNQMYRRLINCSWKNNLMQLRDILIKQIYAQIECEDCQKELVISQNKCCNCSKQHHDDVSWGCGIKACNLCKCIACAIKRNPRVPVDKYLIFEDREMTTRNQVYTILHKEYPKIDLTTDTGKAIRSKLINICNTAAGDSFWQI